MDAHRVCMSESPPGCRRLISWQRVGQFTLILASLAGGLILRGEQQPEIPVGLQNTQNTVAIRADSQEKDRDIYRLTGHVEVRFREMKLTADEASFNEENGDVRAKGNVTFIDATSNLDADEAFYNVQTGVG